MPLCRIFRTDNLHRAEFTFADTLHVEFGHAHTNYTLNTERSKAVVYDLFAHKPVREFAISNGTSEWQRSVMDVTDSLVLIDSALWDLRAKNKLHKFDQLG